MSPTSCQTAPPRDRGGYYSALPFPGSIPMQQQGPSAFDEVDYVSGGTRLYGIVGDPIVQVRSPEMFTATFRGVDSRRFSCRCTYHPASSKPASADSWRCATSTGSSSPFRTRCAQWRLRARWARRRRPSAPSTRSRVTGSGGKARFRRAGLRRGVSPPRHRAARQADHAHRRRRRGLGHRDRGGARSAGPPAAARYRHRARRGTRREGAQGIARHAGRGCAAARRRRRRAAQCLADRHARRCAAPTRRDDAAGASRRLRRNRQARAHAADPPRRIVRLHDGLRARDDARPDRPHGGLLRPWHREPGRPRRV